MEVREWVYAYCFMDIESKFSGMWNNLNGIAKKSYCHNYSREKEFTKGVYNETPLYNFFWNKKYRTGLFDV